MVETEGTELPTPHAVVIEPVSDSESGTEFFDAETGAQNRPLRLLETDPETLSSVSRIPGVNCGRPSAVLLELARYRI
jgi:hypothetical protein